MTGKNNKTFWRAGLIFLAVFFVFFAENKVSAATVACSDSSAKFQCNWVRLSVGSRGQICSTVGAEECNTWCKAQSGWDATKDECRSTTFNPSTYETSGKTNVTSTPPLEDMDNMFIRAIKWALYGVFQFMAGLLGIAAVIFKFVIDPKNVAFITGNAGLYQSWAMVRDFLNLGFILVLLYIAFCVIFQIGSYSDGWKKMLLMMVIMALLVNFSFPICRVIIDISNVAFYYLLNAGFGSLSSGDAIVSSFSDHAGLGTILKTSSEKVSVMYLMAMIVFTFILGLTFFVIACLFVVRMVALGLLIVFSPIGFAGAAFPFSQKYAKDWWDNLFNYAFFAPIMIFMMLIAKNIMTFASQVPFNDIAVSNLGPDADPSFLGTAAFFSIPIAILWFGIGMAKKMSIAGAGAVTGMADKAAKWAGKQVYQAPWKGAKFLSKESGITGAVGARWKQFQDDRALDRARRESGVAGALGVRGAGAAYQQALAKRVKEEAERNDMANMGSTQLRAFADDQGRNEFERAAATQELANRSQATVRDLDNMRAAFGETSQVFRQLQSKVKGYDPTAAFAHLAEPLRQTALIDHLNSNQFDAKKVGSHSLGDSEFMELAMSSGAISNKDIMEIKKDSSKNAAMKRSIGAIVGQGHRNAPTSDEDKNIHMANFALTGQIADAGFASHIAENLDKDNAANMTINALNQIGAHKNGIKQGRIVDIVEGIKNNDVARTLVSGLKDPTSSHANYVRNHPTLRSYT